MPMASLTSDFERGEKIGVVETPGAGVDAHGADDIDPNDPVNMSSFVAFE